MGSGGGGGGGNPALMYGSDAPMPGLPVAGSAGTVNPQEYGKFQSFLPDIKAEGVNDMATGLRPDMFKYRSPNGVVAEGSGGGAGGNDGALRDMLAQLLAGGGGGGAPNYTMQTTGDGQFAPQFNGGGGGSIGTMGMGGGGGGGGSDANGNRPPPGALQLPTPAGGWSRGNAPGWPRGGPGTPIARPGDNRDPLAAAAAAAANQSSGGGPPGGGGGTPGQEFWAAGGSGDPNKRVPDASGLTANDWSLVNQGYFAPMGPPSFQYGVGEGGKPAAAPGAAGGGAPDPAALTAAMMALGRARNGG